mgnify:CR=1 FL=1
MAFLTMLILSDSRVKMMSFAPTAKIAVIVLLFAYVMTNYKEFRDQKNNLFIHFSPFLIYAVLASAWSNDLFLAFQKSLSYALIFFTIPLLYKGALKQNALLANDLVSYLAVILFLGLAGYLISFDFGTLAGRYRGLLGNPNGMGILLTVAGPLYFILKKRIPTFSVDLRTELFFGLVFTLSLILTGSRTALFALLIFVGFLRLKFFSNTFTLVVFAFILLGYDYIFSSLPVVAEFLGLQEYLRIETLDEGSGRFVAWNFAWQQIQDVFFVGGGFGHTETIFKRFFVELSMQGHQGNAHNSYLTLWMNTGIIGIALFGFGLIRSIGVSIKESTYTLPLVYTVLFSANFESWLSASLNPFTSLFLIALSTTMISTESLEEWHSEHKLKANL